MVHSGEEYHRTTTNQNEHWLLHGILAHTNERGLREAKQAYAKWCKLGGDKPALNMSKTYQGALKVGHSFVGGGVRSICWVCVD